MRVARTFERRQQGGQRQLPGGRLQPVSYTHLRAHETVLDLVCRLLLEKKKRTVREVRDTQSHNTTQKNSHKELSH